MREDITKEEAIQELKEIRFNRNARVNGTSRFDAALTYAIEHLEREPCVDCVSREAVLRKMPEHRYRDVNAYMEAKSEIEKLPPVYPISERESEE